MDAELKRFREMHDSTVAPVRGPPVDIGVWEGAKDFNGELISKKKEGRS